MRPASVFAAGKPLGGTKERHLLLADVSLSWQGVTIQILSGRSNSLAFKFAIFLEKHLTGLLAGSAFAPYKRFSEGKTLIPGEFSSPVQMKGPGPPAGLGPLGQAQAPRRRTR